MLIWRSLKPSTILACLSFLALRWEEGFGQRQPEKADTRESDLALQRSRIQEATDEIQSRL